MGGGGQPNACALFWVPGSGVPARMRSALLQPPPLGQVYKGRLHTGEQVAVKVQRPFVLETVTCDLYVIRTIGLFMRRFPQLTERVDVVALLDEWASRFFEEKVFGAGLMASGVNCSAR